MILSTNFLMDEISSILQVIIDKYNLYSEKKGFLGYYVFIGKKKKLLFYINNRSDDVVFGVSHWGTTLLREYPILKVFSDEVMKSTIKWHLYDLEDIKTKGIEKVIELCVIYYRDIHQKKIYKKT